MTFARGLFKPIIICGLFLRAKTVLTNKKSSQMRANLYLFNIFKLDHHSVVAIE